MGNETIVGECEVVRCRNLLLLVGLLLLLLLLLLVLLLKLSAIG